VKRKRRHRSKSRLSVFQAGLIGIILIAAITYGCYTKFGNPFASPYTITATFQNANGLNIGSPVRIAGVNVGKVTGVSAVDKAPGNGGGKEASYVTMQVQGDGLPIHSDANFWIRPRIFLEGNFFVDLYPGSPSAPTVSTGHTFPIQAGREPVQLDQVLTSLQSNTRANLQTLIEQYGYAVKASGPAYASSIKYWTPAYKYSAIVAHDFLGTQPHDLSTWIDKSGTVAGALDAHPQSLKSLLTDFNSVAGAFASESQNLQAAIAELPKTLSVAIPAFNSLNAAFPPLRAFARAFLPGVRSSGPTIDASLPFLVQLRKLVQPAELRGLTSDLSVTVPALARLTQATIPFMKNQVRPAASCVVNDIYPWSQLSLNDGVFSGQPGYPVRKVFQEGVDFLPGLAGESRNFDANGPYIRVLLQGGSLTYSLQPGLFGTALAPITSVQPVLPAGGARPPLMEKVPCETQPAISSLYSPPGAPIKAERTNLTAPGAQLRWQSAVEAALSEINQIGGQTGYKLQAPGLSSLLAKVAGK
jgi:phospholipid/cholesterol/gamma-HCH transport system substrate-binding protein